MKPESAIEIIRRIDSRESNRSEISERQFYDRVLGIIYEAKFEKKHMVDLVHALRSIGCVDAETWRGLKISQICENEYCEGDRDSTVYAIVEFLDNFLRILNVSPQERDKVVTEAYARYQEDINSGKISDILSGNKRVLEYCLDDERKGYLRGIASGSSKDLYSCAEDEIEKTVDTVSKV